MCNIAVRFNSSHSSLFKEILFVLGDQLINNLYKTTSNSNFNKLKINNDLNIDTQYSNVLNLNLNTEHNTTTEDITEDNITTDIENNEKQLGNQPNKIIYDLFYNLDNVDNNMNFRYKNISFILKIINIKNNAPVATRNEVELFSTYEIIFNSNDINIFNEFINMSLHYYTAYYIQYDKKNEKRVKIYIMSPSCDDFQLLCEKTKRNFSSIYLPQEQKQHIKNDLTAFLNPLTMAKYNKLGINYKRIYLLEGIPGTGKTSLIFALASHFNCNIAIINFTPKMIDTDLLHVFQHFTNIERYTDITKRRKTFLICEDIDCIFKERKTNDESRNNITFSGLLNAIDGIATDNVICFITTNYIQHLDSALLRPGRIDYIMKFDYAIKEQIINIYNAFTDTQDKILSNLFYEECCMLNIKITTSLLQQYLLKYIDNPQDAINNINEMKTCFDASNFYKDAEQSGLYS